MKFKEFVFVSLSFVLLLSLILGTVFMKFNYYGPVMSVKLQADKALRTLAGGSNKAFADSEFIPKSYVLPGDDNCGVSIKLDKETSQTRNSGNESANRIVIQNSKYPGAGGEVICVKVEALEKSLKTNIDKNFTQDKAKGEQFFGMTKDELYKMNIKDIYFTYLSKLSDADKICAKKSDLKNIDTIQSKSEKYYQPEYLACDIKVKNEKNEITKILSYNYLFDKESKYMLQLGKINLIDNEELFLVIKDLY